MRSAALLFGLSVVGCARVALGPVETIRTDAGTTTSLVVSDTPDAHYRQDGVTLRVSARHVCDKVEQARRTVVEHRDWENTTPGRDWAAAIVGTAVAATGAGIVIDARNVADTDETGQSYNAFGPTVAYGFGGALVAGGAALFVIPLVDVLRASSGEDRRYEELGEARVAARGLPCERERPFAKLRLAAGVGTVALPLGETDPSGEVEIDLVRALRHEDIAGHARATFLAGEVAGGSIDLGPVHAAHEQAHWAVAAPPCESPSDEHACNDLRRFLERFPDGQHATEARRILAAAEPVLVVHRDDRRWRDARPQECRAAADVAACDGVEAYLTQHPDGPYAPQARAILTEARPKILRLKDDNAWDDADPDTCREATEQADCRGLQEYLAAHPRGRHSAEARATLAIGLGRLAAQREAEARREREAQQRVLRKCRAECQLRCSDRGFRYETCFPACVESECQ